MASPRMCSNNTCKRSVHASCTCCRQYLCRNHFKEHSDLLNAQLSSLIEQINPLFNQLNDVSSPQLAFLTELNQWQTQAHGIVDRFCEGKKREFEEFVQREQNRQKTELARLRDRINDLLKDQHTRQEHTDLISESLRFLQQHTGQFQSPQCNFSPLIIGDQLVTIPQKISRSNLLLPLPSPYRTIELKVDWNSIAANDHHLLVGLGDKLCLLNRELTVYKEIPGTYDGLNDMFWSSTLAQFILLVGRDIFTVDDKSMTVNRYQTTLNTTVDSWYCGTCLNNSLFLAPWHWGSSIYQCTLLPSIQLIKEHQSPFPCTEDEFIWDLSSNNNALALVIINRQGEVRLDLRSSTTFERYWSVQLGCTSNRYRCCPLNNDQWLVNNPNKSELFHITEDGQLVKKAKYETFLPLHAVQLQNNVLAMLTTKGVNLHQLS